MKKILAIVLTAVLSLSVCTAAFGAFGNWQRDGYGWWYQNSDGSYPAGQWSFIDGRYSDPEDSRISSMDTPSTFASL